MRHPIPTNLKLTPSRLLALILAPLLVALLAACAPQPEAFGVGVDAPDFTLTAADGESVSLADYAGQPVLLYFHMAVG